MSLATQLDLFIQQNKDYVFIEAEGKPSTLNNFFADYNNSYFPSISNQTDGIICLEEDANKWGLELRLYFIFCQLLSIQQKIQYIAVNIHIELMMLMSLKNCFL